MLLQVNAAPITQPQLVFTFTVPGHQTWTLISVRALAIRQTGGVPNRSYSLQAANGTQVVADSGATDAGTEPGQCDVTWCNAALAAVAAGATGTSVAPFPNLTLEAGYTLTGTIVNPAAGDTWFDAVAWFTFVENK